MLKKVNKIVLLIGICMVIAGILCCVAGFIAGGRLGNLRVWITPGGSGYYREGPNSNYEDYYNDYYDNYYNDFYNDFYNHL